MAWMNCSTRNVQDSETRKGRQSQHKTRDRSSHGGYLAIVRSCSICVRRIKRPSTPIQGPTSFLGPCFGGWLLEDSQSPSAHLDQGHRRQLVLENRVEVFRLTLNLSDDQKGGRTTLLLDARVIIKRAIIERIPSPGDAKYSNGSPTEASQSLTYVEH